MSVPVRRLGLDDLGALVGLAARVGWVGEDRRYAFLLGTSEVYGLDATDRDGLIGTVTLTRFGPSLATVGMMLVDPEHGGRGHGRTLMEHVIAVAGDVPLALFATAAGRPLYERVGFQTLAENHSYRGRYDGAAPGRSEPFTEDDLAAVIELDRAVSGCDRRAMLERFASFAVELRVTRLGGAVTGYAGRWRHGELGVIGPVIAADADGAVALAADLAAGAGGDVRVEVGDGRAELAAWAEAGGLTRAATTSVMTLGGRPLPGDRDRWFMPVTVAIG